MEQYVKKISPRAEFAIVIVVAFGLSMLGSVLSMFTPSASAPISEAHLQSLLIYEAIVIIVLSGFLSMRGWRLRQLGFMPTIRDTGIGVGLAFVAYLSYAAIWYLSSSLVHGLEEQASSLVTPNLGVTTVLAVSVLNPIFEEVFVCGYIVTALRKTHSISFAINVSIGIRLIYHLYQGSVGVVSIIPLGFIFAYWFARTGRLWPVVISHAIFDFAGLVFYVRS